MASLLVKNPHSILAALMHRPSEVDSVVLPESPQGIWKEIQQIALKNRKISSGLPSSVTQDGGRRSGPQSGGRTNTFGALIRPKEGFSVEEILASSQEKNRILLILDCVQDPQNLGSIFRTAAFYGVSGILMTSERSAPMSSTVYDVSSGGVEVVPFAEVVNLKQALDKLKKADFWILGTSDKAQSDLKTESRDRNWAIVFGNEETGMRRLTMDSCDVLVKIGGNTDWVSSLNVSVTVGSFLEHFRVV